MINSIRFLFFVYYFGSGFLWGSRIVCVVGGFYMVVPVLGRIIGRKGLLKMEMEMEKTTFGGVFL